MFIEESASVITVVTLLLPSEYLIPTSYLAPFLNVLIGGDSRLNILGLPREISDRDISGVPPVSSYPKVVLARSTLLSFNIDILFAF